MSADVRNIKVMYDGIKQAIGPMQYKTAPVKAAAGEVITDSKADGELSRTLLRALLQKEYCQRGHTERH